MNIQTKKFSLGFQERAYKIKIETNNELDNRMNTEPDFKYQG